MKITSGNFKGKNIVTPGGATHPMGERERLALFNMVGNNLSGVSVLDAYAGSGALGVEALSRGAFKVVFVEKLSSAVRVIRENLRVLGVDGAFIEVICAKVGNFETRERFGLILADPPYDDFKATGVARLVDFLDDDGILVLSHPGEAPELPGVVLDKTRAYAGARISIYRKK